MHGLAVFVAITLLSAAGTSFAAPIAQADVAKRESDLVTRSLLGGAVDGIAELSEMKRTIAERDGLFEDVAHTVGDFFHSIFGKKRAIQDHDINAVYAKIENSGRYSQQQLDEVEAELYQKMTGSKKPQAQSRDVKEAVGGETGSVKLGGLTKHFIGVIHSLSQKQHNPNKRELAQRGLFEDIFGTIKDVVGAVFRKREIQDQDIHTRDLARRGILDFFESVLGHIFGKKRAIQDHDINAVYAKIENSGHYSQQELDEVEAELYKKMTGSKKTQSKARAVSPSSAGEGGPVKMGSLTKHFVGLLHSISRPLDIQGSRVASSNGTSNNNRRTSQDLDQLD